MASRSLPPHHRDRLDRLAQQLASCRGLLRMARGGIEIRQLDVRQAIQCPDAESGTLHRSLLDVEVVEDGLCQVINELAEIAYPPDARRSDVLERAAKRFADGEKAAALQIKFAMQYAQWQRDNPDPSGTTEG